MDILREMAESSILETVTKDILKPLKEHQGIVVKDCLHIALDITCNAQFRKCRDTDCMPPPDQCFTDAQSRLVDNIVQCVSTKCTENAFANTTQCNSITASSLAQSSRLIWDTVKEHITGTLTNSDGTVNTEAVNAFQSFCDLIVYYFDQRVTNQDVPLIPMEQCNAWTVDLLNTDVESNINTFNVSNTNRNVTCIPSITQFEENRSVPRWDSGILLGCSTIYFTMAVMLFGKDYTHLHIQCTVVRSGSFITGILMSFLIYVGATHLALDANANPNKSSRQAQSLWRILYLIVSFLCLYGSCLVIVPMPTTPPPPTTTTTRNVSEKKQPHICCFKCCLIVNWFKESFLDANGQFFFLKLVLMEILEMAIQINSLTTSAPTSHVDDVAISSLIIAANFIILPIAIIVAPKIFKSSHAVIATLMVVEMLFDKLYVGVGVLLRSNTITDRKMDVWAQITVHGALLLPAMLTALDISDALALSNSMSSYAEEEQIQQEPASRNNKKRKARASVIVRVNSNMNNIVHSNCVLATERIFLAISIVLGLVLGIYTLIATVSAAELCTAKLGSIAYCADQKFYFSNGFFSTTTCAFEKVETFSCSGLGVRHLPNANEEYSNMFNLISIDVQNSSLESAPSGWSRIPSKVSIDLSHSRNFHDLPYTICSPANSITKLQFQGTLAANSLNWTEQILAAHVAANVTSTDRYNNNGINDACMHELARSPYFTSLSLGRNELKDNDLAAHDEGPHGNEHLGNALLKLRELTYLDLSYNSLQIIYVDITERVLRPIIERHGTVVNADDDNTHPAILLTGNTLNQFAAYVVNYKLAAGMIKMLEHCKSVVDVSFVTCQLEDADIVHVSSFIGRLRIESLELNSNKIGDAGAEAIADALPGTVMDKLLLANNKLIGIIGVTALANAIPKSNLAKLTLHGTNMGDDGIRALVNVISGSIYYKTTKWNHPGFRYLGITGTKVTLNGLRELYNAIAARPADGTTFGLEISSLNLGDSGAKDVADLLLTSNASSVLHELTIADNEITDVGARLIAIAAIGTTKLHSFRMKNNLIGRSGAEALSALLRSPRTGRKFKYFEVNGNVGFGKEGEEMLKQACLDSVELQTTDFDKGSCKECCMFCSSQYDLITGYYL